MCKENATKCESIFSRHNLSKLNQGIIQPDGRITISLKHLTGQEQGTEALVYQTNSGYKLISLAPDVKKVYIEVTTLCNFDCITCIRNSWEDELGIMELPVFQLLVEQLSDLPNLECVHFGGFGEPLSHPHIFEMIKRVKDLGLNVEMISNGSLLNEEVAGKLVDLGLDRLFVSLDGPDEAEFNDIRKGADFNSIIANIRNFNRVKSERHANRPELAIEFVAMKKNYHKLPQLARLLDELQARYLLVTNVLPYCEELKDEIVYDLDDTVPLFGNDSTWLMMRAQLPHMKLRTLRNCKFIEDKALTITWEGNVAPCYALMHSYKCYIYGREKKIFPHHLGDIKDKSVKAIWTDPVYAVFRSTVKDFHFPSCTDCKYLEGCSMADDNEMDCWGNSPSCAECLWSRGIIVCP